METSYLVRFYDPDTTREGYEDYQSYPSFEEARKAMKYLIEQGNDAWIMRVEFLHGELHG